MYDFILPPDDLKPVIILDDRGGRVSDYFRAAKQYTLEGREVRIIGLCWSACSIALAVPKVCVSPMATVMFHNAYDLKSGKTDILATKVLVNNMPEKIQKAVGGLIQKEFNAAATLDAKKLMTLGIKSCTKGLY